MSSLNFNLHKKQGELLKIMLNPNTKYLTVNAGRRFGKSHVGLIWIGSMMLSKKTKGLVMTNNHSQAKTLFYELLEMFRGQYISRLETQTYHWDDVNKTDKSIIFKNGSKLKFYVAEGYERIRGEDATYFLLDEVAMYQPEVFPQVVQPLIITHPESKVLMLSTPRGKNHWFDLYNNGFDKTVPEWVNYHAPSQANPNVSMHDLDSIRKTIPELIYKQEYEAEFIENEGSVFKNINNSRQANPQTEYKKLLIGIDLGMTNDYTVVIGFNENMEWILYNRFRGNSIDECTEQIDKVLEPYKKDKNCTINIETNRFDSVYTLLKQKNYRIFKTDIGHKEKLQNVQELSILFERNQIKIPDLPEVYQEFQNFQYYITQAGNLTYSGKGSNHDDVVMATCAALRAKKQINLHRSSVI